MVRSRRVEGSPHDDLPYGTLGKLETCGDGAEACRLAIQIVRAQTRDELEGPRETTSALGAMAGWPLAGGGRDDVVMMQPWVEILLVLSGMRKRHNIRDIDTPSPPTVRVREREGRRLRC